MDYVVGSVADLVAGNVTPRRAAPVKRALTPVKHQPSPHVTPRADPLPDGRDALLSPSVLRKKAVVKKSPKRIFEKDDLDKTSDGDTKSPNVEKVKKHLKAQLDNSEVKKIEKVKASKRKVQDENVEGEVEDYIEKHGDNEVEGEPKKKKKRRKKKKENLSTEKIVQLQKQQSKEQKSSISVLETASKSTTGEAAIKTGKNKNRRRNKNKQNIVNVGGKAELKPAETTSEKKKSDKKIKHKNKNNVHNDEEKTESKPVQVDYDKHDSDSEHESDDEIESETEQDVKQILDSGPIEGDNSSDEEEKEKSKNPKSKPKKAKKKKDSTDTPASDADIANRTLFVGNVPLSKKCKKEIRQIFNKYGSIETVRIRTVPVKDLRTDPKVALIRNEIHPERSSVNVYVKFSEEDSVTRALSENNRLMGEKHLRVTRSDTSGLVHDPRKTVFLGNIPFGIEDDALRAKFERCGEIESVRIVRDKASQIGKGFGYVNFASSDGVELALSLSEEDLTIKNRIMRIRRYTQAAPGQKVKGQFQNNRFNNPGGRNDRNGKGDPWSKGGQSGFANGKAPRDDSGALKRINNKRKFQENSSSGGAGPSHKKQRNLDQPIKEKKAKKEFVGLTAEKKKKRKFDKGQKNKKKLSEILTKS